VTSLDLLGKLAGSCQMNIQQKDSDTKGMFCIEQDGQLLAEMTCVFADKK